MEDVYIYIIDRRHGDIYIRGDVPEHKNSIILVYTGGHYNAASLGETTYFRYDHPLIEFLRNRVLLLKK